MDNVVFIHVFSQMFIDWSLYYSRHYWHKPVVLPRNRKIAITVSPAITQTAFEC